jgi:hypothetical protein
VFDWDGWFQTLWDVLQSDDEACAGLLRSAGGQMGGTVALVEGDASPDDALAYARTLSELGFVTEGREILAEVMRSVFGGWWSEKSAAA